MLKVSIVIPAYNCARVLDECLGSIAAQDYPKELIELIVVDGFSTDGTRQAALKYGATVLDNPDVTHPAGRPIGIKAATGELILCLDSDNILPEKGWLEKMTAPFEDGEIAASEPLYYTAAEGENAITNYCALIGGDDPVVVYLGYNDRHSWLTGRWPKSPTREADLGGYIKVKFLDPYRIPSLGANGFMVRKEVLLKVPHAPFHHVEVSHRIIKLGYSTWAKVKTGVIHRHGDSVYRFIVKKKRRAERRLDKNAEAGYAYPAGVVDLLKVAVRALLFFPVVLDSIRAYKRKPSRLWLYHPFISFLVVLLYGSTVIKRRFVSSKDDSYEKV